jgi:hypothetical protein
LTTFIFEYVRSTAYSPTGERYEFPAADAERSATATQGLFT